ncbi:MAG: helix-turn-helix domain-containing protein [Kosmotogaceae bacterium]
MEEKFRDEFENDEMDDIVEMDEETEHNLEKVLERIANAEESGYQSADDFKKVIARNIEIYMDLTGFSKNELAEKIDITVQELEWIIDGKWNPTLDEFFRLFEKLNWKLSVLIMLNEDPTEELEQ